MPLTHNITLYRIFLLNNERRFSFTGKTPFLFSNKLSAILPPVIPAEFLSGNPDGLLTAGYTFRYTLCTKGYAVIGNDAERILIIFIKM